MEKGPRARAGSLGHHIGIGRRAIVQDTDTGTVHSVRSKTVQQCTPVGIVTHAGHRIQRKVRSERGKVHQNIVHTATKGCTLMGNRGEISPLGIDVNELYNIHHDRSGGYYALSFHAFPTLSNRSICHETASTVAASTDSFIPI